MQQVQIDFVSYLCILSQDSYVPQWLAAGKLKSYIQGIQPFAREEYILRPLSTLNVWIVCGGICSQTYHFLARETCQRKQHTTDTYPNRNIEDVVHPICTFHRPLRANLMV